MTASRDTSNDHYARWVII